jgi:hypothetical protein
VAGETAISVNLTADPETRFTATSGTDDPGPCTPAPSALDAPGFYAYVPETLCPGPDPGADWQRYGWCCRDCAAAAHLAWCANHLPGNDPRRTRLAGLRRAGFTPLVASDLAMSGGYDPDEWGCTQCGAAHFGTPPEDGMCRDCREHGR